MNMATFAAVFATLWVAQMLLTWRQAKRFTTGLATLRGSGVVVTGRHQRGGLRTYAALAVKENRVTGSLVLKGISVFARPRPHPALLGATVEELAAGRAAGVDRRTAAAAAHAATLYLEQRSRRTRPIRTKPTRPARVTVQTGKP